MLNSTIFIAQGLLAAVFALTGGAKLILPKQTLQKRMHWAASWPPRRIKLLGLAEVLGGIGLVLPGATGIAEALTPVAALCLAVLMAGAIATHRRLGERILPAVIVGALCLLVAVARSPLLLPTVLPAAAAGPSMAPAVFSPLQDARPPRAQDGGTTRADQPRAGIPSVQPPRGGVVQVSAVDDAPDPSPRISVKARTESTGGQPDPYMEALLEQSRAQSEALLEQSRAQTEALQQIAAQQRASEATRFAEQRAQAQRAGQLNGARIAIGGALQSLQAMGDWNADSLDSTGASLRQTAAAASEAGSAAEASRASEAARFVEGAHAALAQRNAQLAQYYLLVAHQLLLGVPSGR
jgi:hypothetical protein